jgi:uncharacterized protein
MEENREVRCTAFSGMRRVAAGSLIEVVRTITTSFVDETGSILVFDDATSEPIEVDWRGTPEEALARLASSTTNAPRGPGRPKLGVVAREVTLLPRHWQWLSDQPGGASVMLRKLVERAMRDAAGADRRRHAQETCYRFITALAGNLPGYEEATRTLFAGDAAGFASHTAAWPVDVRNHATMLAADAFVLEQETGGCAGQE